MNQGGKFLKKLWSYVCVVGGGGGFGITRKFGFISCIDNENWPTQRADISSIGPYSWRQTGKLNSGFQFKRKNKFLHIFCISKPMVFYSE